ncbi:hypothetical protein [Marinicellulosiphila megalodicopiae]|uniref:hypothetical protein n=1 Tax=Marinicellulosiphila megalodicopiae TaxID=2724896 RepID=UPI003BB0F122
MLYKSHNTIIQTRLQRDSALQTISGIQKQQSIDKQIIEQARRQREDYAEGYRQVKQQLEDAANDCGNDDINSDYIIMFDAQFGG